MRSHVKISQSLGSLNLVIVLVLVFEAVRAFSTLECINTKKDFDNYRWKGEGSFEYDPTGDVFILSGGNQGVTRVSKAAEDFFIGDADTATYLYIKYSSLILNDGEPSLVVRPVEDESLEKVNITANAEQELIMELWTDGIAYGLNVEIDIEDFKGGDNLQIDTIAVYYGIKYTDPNVRPPLDEVKAVIIEVCNWIPDPTTISPSTEHQDTPLQKLQCIDQKTQFDHFQWMSPPSAQYGNNAADLPFAGIDEAAGIFYVEGNIAGGHLKYFTLIKDKLSPQNVFLYIRHNSYITKIEEHKISVSTSATSDLTEVELGSMYTWNEAIVALDSELVTEQELELNIQGFREGEYFSFDKIALFTGLPGSRSDADIIEEISTVCDWDASYTAATPPITTETPPDTAETPLETTEKLPDTTETLPETTRMPPGTTETPSNTDRTEPNTPETTPDNTGTSSERPVDLEIEVIRIAADFEQTGWTSNPHYMYANKTEDFPAAAIDGGLKIEDEGVFYFEGDEPVPVDKTIEKYLTYSNPTLPTYLYLKYYALVTSDDPRPMVVSPTEGPGSETQLESTSGFKWAETFFRIKQNSSNPVRIKLEYFVPGEYFFLDEIFLVHGDREFDNIEEIKETVQEYVENKLAANSREWN